MKKYILTLPGCEERAEAVRQRLADTPFRDAVPYYGYDGRKQSEQTLHALMDVDFFSRRHHRMPTCGEIGCAVSHRRIWTEAADNNEAITVFEDDILLTRKISSAEAHSWGEWLSSDEPRILLMCDSVIYRPHDVHCLPSGFRIVKPYESQGAFAYSINAAAARILTSKPLCDTVADDWPLFQSFGISIYATCPAAFEAIIEGSLIGFDRLKMNFSFLRRLQLFLADKQRKFLLRSGIWKHL